MATPRNNLQDVLRQRTANTSISVASVETLSTGQRLSKFKPAQNAPVAVSSTALSSNVQRTEVRKAVTTTTSTTTLTPTSLPTFSTPGFGKGKFKAAIQRDTSFTLEAEASFSHQPSSSSGSSKSSSLKRSSSDIPPPSPGRSTPRIKRSKSSHSQDDKENDPDTRPEKTGKSPQRLRKVNQPVSSHDPLNLQVFAFQASSSKNTVVQRSAATLQKDDTSGFIELGISDWFSGLNNKSTGELKELLRINRNCLSQTNGMIAEFDKGTNQEVDIVMMRFVSQVFDSRVSAIRITMDDKERALDNNAINDPLAAGPSTTMLIEGEGSTSKNSDPFNGSESDDELWASLGEIPDIDIPPTPERPLVTRPAELAADQTSTPYYKEVSSVLKDVFQLDSFRYNQLEAINATMEGRDVFVLMPTGGGKSLCYQLPAVCHSGKTDGVTIVVSPLIALMNDQVNHLKAKGVDAELFNSDQDSDISRNIRSRLCGGGRKPRLLYLTPEKLHHSNDMRNILSRLHQQKSLARFVIDEAHTVSTWGRDFRDAYKELGRLREDYPGIPIMALTATANDEIKNDVMDRLKIRGCLFLEQSFNRPNLHYEVRKKVKGVVADIANYIKTNHANETGIIYCFSRNKCEAVALELRNKHNIRARHYHAQLSPADKHRTQQAWQTGECEIIVATIAFGMGIDKADVRFVIHHQLPMSMDGYYQETGRAGRDGKEARCILYFTYSDTRYMFKIIDENETTPPEEKKRQTDAILAVARYCYNNTDCRRSLVLHHFGQMFTAEQCGKMCDTCKEDFRVVEEDMSAQGKLAIRLIDSMSATQRNGVTKTHCLDVFRGSKAKSVTDKGYDRLPLFGCGQEVSRDRADRLIDNLMYNGALKEKCYNNLQGWNNAGIVLADKADEYLSGREKLMMKFRADEPQWPPKRKAGGTTTKKRTKSKPDRAGSKDQGEEMALWQDEDIEDF